MWAASGRRRELTLTVQAIGMLFQFCSASSSNVIRVHFPGPVKKALTYSRVAGRVMPYPAADTTLRDTSWMTALTTATAGAMVGDLGSNDSYEVFSSLLLLSDSWAGREAMNR